MQKSYQRNGILRRLCKTASFFSSCGLPWTPFNSVSIQIPSPHCSRCHSWSEEIDGRPHCNQAGRRFFITSPNHQLPTTILFTERDDANVKLGSIKRGHCSWRWRTILLSHAQSTSSVLLHTSSLLIWCYEHTLAIDRRHRWSNRSDLMFVEQHRANRRFYLAESLMSRWCYTHLIRLANVTQFSNPYTSNLHISIHMVSPVPLRAIMFRDPCAHIW